jgi:hypothetical protein
MSAPFLALLLLLAAPAKSPKPPPKEAPKEAVKETPPDAPRAAPAAAAASSGLGLLTPAKRRHAPQTTACASCHSTSSWTETKFNHARTGFPLEGKHAQARCKACHPVDFQRSVPASCAGCHLDLHAGELGGRCEGCHDPASWKSRFPADAHRFTGFPLVGRHAALPCGECHFTEAAGRFSRAASGCAACHQADYDNTAGSSLDHRALGFPDTCQGCHQGWTFKGARFPEHDGCFPITRGPHAEFSCGDCHQGPYPAALTLGTCSSRNVTCIGCHTGEHDCARSTQQHVGVMGFSCQEGQDLRCYGCHKMNVGDP